MQAERGRLKAILERNRLQQKHVAEALKVSRMTVFGWVHQRSVPTGTNLLRLVEFLRRFEPGLRHEDIYPGIDPAASAVFVVDRASRKAS